MMGAAAVTGRSSNCSVHANSMTRAPMVYYSSADHAPHLSVGFHAVRCASVNCRRVVIAVTAQRLAHYWHLRRCDVGVTTIEHQRYDADCRRSQDVRHARRSGGRCRRRWRVEVSCCATIHRHAHLAEHVVTQCKCCSDCCGRQYQPSTTSVMCAAAAARMTGNIHLVRISPRRCVGATSTHARRGDAIWCDP